MKNFLLTIGSLSINLLILVNYAHSTGGSMGFYIWELSNGLNGNWTINRQLASNNFSPTIQIDWGSDYGYLVVVRGASDRSNIKTSTLTPTIDDNQIYASAAITNFDTVTPELTTWSEQILTNSGDFWGAIYPGEVRSYDYYLEGFSYETFGGYFVRPEENHYYTDDMWFKISILGGGSGTIEKAWFDVGSNPVPEPATMLLFGTGLAGLAGTRIRRKMKKKK